MLELRCYLCPTSQQFHKDARKIASYEAAWPPQSGQLATFSGAPFMLLGGLGLLHPFQAGASMSRSLGPKEAHSTSTLIQLACSKRQASQGLNNPI